MDFIDLKEYISKTQILKLIYKGGIGAYIFVILLLLSNHLDVIPLEKIPYLVDFLFLYLLVNVAIATPFSYLEKKLRVAVGKFCPYCNAPLEKIDQYKCPNCGKLKVE